MLVIQLSYLVSAYFQGRLLLVSRGGTSPMVRSGAAFGILEAAAISKAGQGDWSALSIEADEFWRSGFFLDDTFVDGNQKSGIHSPVEGMVVEIPLFTRFTVYIPGGCLGFLISISAPMPKQFS